MKAEKTRQLLDELDCKACGYAKEMLEKGFCFHSCEDHYRLDDEIEVELTELERLASKQNPTKPISLVSDVDEKIGNIVFAKGVKIYKCQCGKLINFKDSFCRNCGQKQDWQ